MEPFLALIVAGGAAAYALARRGRSHERWREILEEAVKDLEGRVSSGTRFDAPQVRAEVDELTVTAELRSAHKDPKKIVAFATAELPSEVDARLYFGWDVGPTPKSLEYISEVEYARGFDLDGEVHVRASSSELSHAFARRSMTDLLDLRREAGAHGLEVLVRGASVEVTVHGFRPTSATVRRLMIVTARAARSALAASGNELPSGARGVDPMRLARGSVPPEDESFEPATCTLCGRDRKPREAWVQCHRCGTPYHARCHRQAAGCIGDGCREVRTEPLAS